MILRRLMKHIREQNWFAVGLDLAIVIVGVALGVQVTAWAGDRVDAQRAEEYRERLAIEIDTAIGGITYRQDRLHRSVVAARQLRAIIAGEDAPDPDQLASVTYDATLITGYEPGSAIYAELVSTGRLDLLEDRLIDALSAYEEEAEHSLEIWRTFIDNREPHYVTILNHVDVTETASLRPGDGLNYFAFSDVDLEALRSDPSVDNALKRLIVEATGLRTEYGNQVRCGRALLAVLEGDESISTQECQG